MDFWGEKTSNIGPYVPRNVFCMNNLENITVLSLLSVYSWNGFEFVIYSNVVKTGPVSEPEKELSGWFTGSIAVEP